MPLQLTPQSIPAGELVIVPVPLPVLAMLKFICIGAKLAVTFCVWFMVTVQVAAVPVHAPVQPWKIEPVAGVAVKVTGVFQS